MTLKINLKTLKWVFWIHKNWILSYNITKWCNQIKLKWSKIIWCNHNLNQISTSTHILWKRKNLFSQRISLFHNLLMFKDRKMDQIKNKKFWMRQIRWAFNLKNLWLIVFKMRISIKMMKMKSVVYAWKNLISAILDVQSWNVVMIIYIKNV